MSLSKLPIDLFAQIGSFLEFEDVKKLLSTNKKINGVVKYYKLDKPKVHEIFLELYPEDDAPVILLKTVKGSMFVEYPNEFIQTFKNNSPLSVVRVLKKFLSIEVVNIVGIAKISDYYLKVLMEAKLKIVHLAFTQSEVKEAEIKFSMKVLVQLYETFKQVSFRGWDVLLGKKFGNDQVFTQLVKFDSIIFEKRDNVQNQLPSFRVKLSDKTLEAMVNQNIPTTFNIQPWTTSFTVQGIRSLFEQVHMKKVDILWHLGILDAVHMEDAKEFILDLDITIYDGMYQERTGYTVYVIAHDESYKKTCNFEFCIRFAVLLDESDGEDEDMEEEEEEIEGEWRSDESTDSDEEETEESDEEMVED